MKIIRTITGLTMITLSSLSLAADSEIAAILKCKAMQGDAARLACYDALESEASAKPAAPPSAPPSPTSSSADVPPVVKAATVAKEAVPANVPPVAATTTVAKEAAPVLDDDIGRENMAPSGGEQLTVRGEVVSCRENLSGKLVFTFANGQVWQQKDNKNPHWRDCKFGVTIRKDFFGYVMKPDNNDKQLRIARVK